MPWQTFAMRGVFQRLRETLNSALFMLAGSGKEPSLAYSLTLLTRVDQPYGIAAIIHE